LKIKSPAALEHFIAEQRSDTTRQYEAVLIFERVLVERRRERPRGHRMLHQRDTAARLVAPEHEPDADAPEEAGDAVVGPYDLSHVAPPVHE
jgi:hypothetical protein